MVVLNIHMVRQARGSNVVAPFGRSDIVVARSPRGQGLFFGDLNQSPLRLVMDCSFFSISHSVVIIEINAPPRQVE